MPNSITGNTPAPMLNNGQPSSNPLAILQPDRIRMVNGLYCLNDLHKMAGGKPKDTPSRFIILAKTQALIQAFEKLAQIQNPKKGFDLSPVIQVIHGGDMQGVYACKPLMFAYTSWLNADFHALVYTVFDGATTGEITFSTLEQEVNFITRLTNRMRDNGSIAGYVLNKCKFRKVIEQKLQLALERQQLTLALGE